MEDDEEEEITPCDRSCNPIIANSKIALKHQVNVGMHRESGVRDKADTDTKHEIKSQSKQTSSHQQHFLTLTL